jgi:hypothetical protein
MLVFVKKYRRTIILGLIILLVAMAGLVYFSIRTVNDLFETDKVMPTASQYAEWVGLWLPGNVQNFQAYGEGWQDWLVEAKFELSVSEWSEFMERNKLQSNDLEIGLESSYQLEWFSSGAKLEVYQIEPLPNQAASTSTGFYATFWLDKTNSGTVVVYVKANDT